MLHAWYRRKEIERKIRAVDEMYGDQYDELFPDIDKCYEDLANVMDEPIEDNLEDINPEFYTRMEFINKVEDAYMEVWGTEKQLPCIDVIVDYMQEWLEEKIIEKAMDDYGENFEDIDLDMCSEFDEDGNPDPASEAYRMTCDWYDNSMDGYEFEKNICRILNYMGYTYIDSRSSVCEEERIMNPSQLKLFPWLKELL